MDENKNSHRKITMTHTQTTCHPDVYSSNKGILIGFVKLMSKYEPVLGKYYLKEVNDYWQYLSPKIQDEFIPVLGNHVKENILDRIRKANYFAIALDGTPDISQSDQKSFICRNVIVENKEVEVRESFLGFIIEHEKTTHDIKKMILDELEKEKLDLKKCRGIGFDNEANITGILVCVQRFLRNINGKDKFVPCSNHCLNFSGVYSSAVNASAITFFGVIERLYIFLFFLGKFYVCIRIFYSFSFLANILMLSMYIRWLIFFLRFSKFASTCAFLTIVLLGEWLWH